MSEDNVCIQINSISKVYKIKHINSAPYKRINEVILNKIKSIIVPWKSTSYIKNEDFFALKEITLSINKGDKIAIIGRNGAGKSTLLKILSRITEPSDGEVRIKGRIASLLEVGTGFHPELTGKENIYLNGAILGMTKAEIRDKFDEIVKFSGCEKFIDTPVKRYSSGMRVRLGFAVAAYLESEILIVDEVLAVGDSEFQKKCLGKMDEIAKGQGRTIIFVSHNMSAIKNLCDRAVLLKDGEIEYIGSTETAINKYLGWDSNQDGKRELNRNKSIIECNVEMPLSHNNGDDLVFDVYIKCTEDIANVYCDFAILDSHGEIVFQYKSKYKEYSFLLKVENKLSYTIKDLSLMNKQYTLFLHVATLDNNILYRADNIPLPFGLGVQKYVANSSVIPYIVERDITSHEKSLC